MIIMEACNPQKARDALKNNINTGYFIPCKTVVYVEDGQTKMGIMKPTAQAGLIKGGFLAGFATEVEVIMIKASEAAK